MEAEVDEDDGTFTNISLVDDPGKAQGNIKLLLKKQTNKKKPLTFIFTRFPSDLLLRNNSESSPHAPETDSKFLNHSSSISEKVQTCVKMRLTKRMRRTV